MRDEMQLKKHVIALAEDCRIKLPKKGEELFLASRSISECEPHAIKMYEALIAIAATNSFEELDGRAERDFIDIIRRWDSWVYAEGANSVGDDVQVAEEIKKRYIDKLKFLKDKNKIEKTPKDIALQYVDETLEGLERRAQDSENLVGLLNEDFYKDSLEKIKIIKHNIASSADISSPDANKLAKKIIGVEVGKNGLEIKGGLAEWRASVNRKGLPSVNLDEIIGLSQTWKNLSIKYSKPINPKDKGFVVIPQDDWNTSLDVIDRSIKQFQAVAKNMFDRRRKMYEEKIQKPLDQLDKEYLRVYKDNEEVVHRYQQGFIGQNEAKILLAKNKNLLNDIDRRRINLKAQGEMLYNSISADLDFESIIDEIALTWEVAKTELTVSEREYCFKEFSDEKILASLQSPTLFEKRLFGEVQKAIMLVNEHIKSKMAVNKGFRDKVEKAKNKYINTQTISMEEIKLGMDMSDNEFEKMLKEFGGSNIRPRQNIVQEQSQALASEQEQDAFDLLLNDMPKHTND